jgi:hypothetical protein
MIFMHAQGLEVEYAPRPEAFPFGKGVKHRRQEMSAPRQEAEHHRAEIRLLPQVGFSERRKACSPAQGAQHPGRDAHLQTTVRPSVWPKTRLPARFGQTF